MIFRPFLLAGLIALAVAAPRAGSALGFDTDFEGSNLGSWALAGPDTVDITIRPDTSSTQYRWYSFKLTGRQGQPTTIRITNAGGANAAAAWSFNKPVVSGDDGATWSRVMETSYSGGVFTWTHTPQSDSEWYALVPPYPFQRWLDLVDSLEGDPRVFTRSVIAHSLQGRPVHMLGITAPGVNPMNRPGIWITSRVHPAETGSSWQLEGFLEWLLSEDPDAAALLNDATFWIVGVLNPDGVALGNYRLDTNGRNLNREWNNSNAAQVPTIKATTDRMRGFVDNGGGILAFFDLHSHSSIRANFVYWNNQSAGLSASQVEDIEAFMAAYEEANPDFSVARSSGGATTTLGVAKNWVWNELGVVHSYTFESSYQDITYGAGGFMDIPRYKALGEDLGRAALAHFFGGGNPSSVGDWESIPE